jgi:archaellum component FlaC
LALLTSFYLEKYLKKLMGNTEIEESLQRLDKLTQEEARMASAELLRITHSVQGRVMGVDARVEDVGGDVQNVDKRVQVVDDRVQGVDDKIQGIDNRVKGIDDEVKDVGDRIQDIDSKLDDTNRSSPHSSLVHHSECSGHFTGNLLRSSLLQWLSPSDPSTNHNIASNAHHDGTAQWFFQGSIFKEWKSAGSFLWIHGKRVFKFDFTPCHQP